MTQLADTPRWAARRRPFDHLEKRLVQLALDLPTEQVRGPLDEMRYALSFARLTTVRTTEGSDVDVTGILHLHAMKLRELVEPRITNAKTFWDALSDLPEVIRRTQQARASVLEHLPIDRDSLEEEVTTRQLVVASGGGGGAGYVYPGAYDMLDRARLVPKLMVGTSIGALMSMFRARREQFDLAALVAAARVLSWAKVFRVLQSESKYGLPATLRLYLRNALGPLFEIDGEPMRLSDMAIPLYTVATGITVDALKHDLNYYEHFFEEEVNSTAGMKAKGGLKAMSILREFMGSREALREIVLGRAEGTRDFDVLDAAGFSAAIPGIIHYDVIRDDPRMTSLLDALYAAYGITRLGEGGMVSNLPARIAWETAVSGKIANGRRNNFVLALDCFAPSRRRLAWFPLQQLIRQSNVLEDRKYADCYVSFDQTLSPLNLVPSVADAMTAIRWGRETLRPKMPFIKEMMREIKVLKGSVRSAAAS